MLNFSTIQNLKTKNNFSLIIKEKRMSITNHYVFVLWSHKFEEVPATIFTTQLRDVGLRVKVVGLSYKKMPGMNGLVLHPDFTLEKALPLANKAISVIIPSGLIGIQSLKNDLRLFNFFSQANHNQAQFVIGDLVLPTLNKYRLFPPSVNHLNVYPKGEKLFGFASQFATSLLSSTSKKIRLKVNQSRHHHQKSPCQTPLSKCEEHYVHDMHANAKQLPKFNPTALALSCPTILGHSGDHLLPSASGPLPRSVSL